MQSQAQPSPPVGRLAPSPTGLLHLGHAYAFLHASWAARSQGGRLHLRMDDLDRSRSRPEFESAALADLEWLGITWDGAILRASQDLTPYRAALEQLIAEGVVYACNCTRRVIMDAVGAPHAGEELRYPGTCRPRRVPPEGAAWRLWVSAGRVEGSDPCQGSYSFDIPATVGDFEVWTRADLPAYQLASVVDDRRQGVTQIVRGADLLASHARQRLVATALSLEQPAGVHVPLVVDGEGQRLAKRDGARSLGYLRAAGVRPEAILAWAAEDQSLADLCLQDAHDRATREWRPPEGPVRQAETLASLLGEA